MKLLVLTSRFPFPINKGDKLRAYFQIIELSKTCEIHLISLHDHGVKLSDKEKLEKYCKSIHLFKLNKLRVFINLLKTFINNKPFQVNYFYHKKIQKDINDIIKKINPDHIFCQLIRTALYVKDQHKISSTIDYMDSLSLGLKRRISISRKLIKPILQIEYQRLVKFENLAFEFFNNHIIISKFDRENINHEERNSIKVIPNGVNIEIENKSYKKEYDLVFIGNLSYKPNIEAANYIIDKIIPLLKPLYSDIKVLIAGSNASNKLKKKNSKYVTIKGWVDDIKESYCMGKVFFAPMTIGSGLQNKLLEAMSLGLPCITSKLANNSLNATNNENILIGNSPSEYVNQIRRCLDDRLFREKIGKQGKKYVVKNFNWKDINKDLLTIFQT